jgi:outer membrane protein OmpA-like peptidoglycan-associated protein
MNHPHVIRTGLLLAFGAGALTACSSTTQPNAALNQAQATYSAASSDPLVRKTAPEKLADAQETLQIAQQAWNDGDQPRTDHNAYLAQRYAQTAVEAAKFRVAAQQAADAARIVTLPGVLFAADKANLNANGTQAVKDLANFLRVRPDRKIMITGYTDSTGSHQINSALSEGRATAVKAALVSQGLDASRIQTRGMGPANPLGSNATATGRQRNRRVEVLISETATTSGAGASALRRG